MCTFVSFALSTQVARNRDVQGLVSHVPTTIRDGRRCSTAAAGGGDPEIASPSSSDLRGLTRLFINALLSLAVIYSKYKYAHTVLIVLIMLLVTVWVMIGFVDCGLCVDCVCRWSTTTSS